MATFKSLLPFWRHPLSPGEPARSEKPDDFGTASSFELLFNRLMDDPQTDRETLFPTGCRRS